MAILLIGSTGNGKSTLGNFLIDPSESHMFGENAAFQMARSNKPQTQVVSCKEFKRRGFILKVIDTPGLNENAAKDLEHMSSLIKFLNDPNLGGVRVCLLCIKFNSKLDAQYKATVAYYSRLLPSLFERNVLIVVTEFMTDDRTEKLRKKQGIDVESVKTNIAYEIRRSAQLGYTPPLFTINCLPTDKEECVYNMRVRDTILGYILSMSSISTTDLQVQKTDYLRQLDENEIGRIKGEISGYNNRLMECNKDASDVLTTLEELEEEIVDTEGAIANTKNELLVKDSTGLVVANSWSVNRESKTEKLLHEKFHVLSEWKIYNVRCWKNSRAEWCDVQETEYEVSGSLQGEYIRGLHASVTLETIKQIKFAKEIEELKKELEGLHQKLTDLKKEEVKYHQRHIKFQREMELLKTHIDEKKGAIEMLYVNTLSVADAMKRVDELRVLQ